MTKPKSFEVDVVDGKIVISIPTSTLQNPSNYGVLSQLGVISEYECFGMKHVDAEGTARRLALLIMDQLRKILR